MNSSREDAFRQVPWRCVSDGVQLFVHLTPKASNDAIGDIVNAGAGVVLKARVRALPDKGKANQALIILLSKWLGVPKASLELTSGARSRHKSIKITGKNAEIIKLLETLIK